jgi:autotransporter-associated beta strand protein
MPVRLRGRRLALPAAVLVLVASAAPAAAQTTYLWTGAAGEIGPGQWLNTVNWSVNGGPNGFFPGVTASGLSTSGAATDVARFNTFPNGASNGCGIDFGAAGGQLTLGAIQYNDNLGGYAIGNMSTTTAGVLRLNGATITTSTGPVANVVLGQTGQSSNVYPISPLPSGATGGPGLTLQLGTPDAVFLSSLAVLRINVPISEAAPGYGVTISGLVQFFQPNTYSGPTHIIGGSLTINQDAALGTAPSSPTPNQLVIATSAELNTNAATFTINANRGIAVGPTSGSGGGTINVPDPEITGYTATITYNGVITDNGTGAGRLVKSGGGTLVLGGSNTFTGGTLHNGGVLLLTNVNALGTVGTVTIAPQGSTVNTFTPLPGNLLVQATGTFARPITVSYTGTATHQVIIGTPDFGAGGANETLFSGAITLNNRPATFQGGNDYRTRFTGPITGTGAVTTTGTAAGRTVVFDSSTGNDFTYSGGTTVASGTLLAVGQSATMSATGPGAVGVTGGVLGGNGRVAGAVSVASGGRVTAGTDLASRTLTLGGTLQIDGGKYRVTLFGGGNEEASKLAVAAAATLTNSPAVELDLNGQTVAGLRAGGPRTYTILTASSVTPNGFAPANFTALGFDASEWSLSYPNGNSVVLSFTPVPVPEPTAVLALAAGIAGACGLVRRGRAR